MSGTIKAGTIMMKAGTVIPQSLRVETEPYSQGWEIIKNSDAEAVDRDIRRADWNFFFLAASIQATALGCWGERTIQRTIRRAIERVLAKAEPSKLNCLEITEVSAKQFLSLRARLGALTAYPEEPISTRARRPGRAVADADWATARTPLCGGQSVWKVRQRCVPNVAVARATPPA